MPDTKSLEDLDNTAADSNPETKEETYNNDLNSDSVLFWFSMIC